MPQSTLLFILLAAVVAIVLASYQYFHRTSPSHKYHWFLAVLRAATLFCVLLLLINPSFQSREYYTEKPELVVAVDNSTSIANFNQTAAVTKFVAAITEDRQLQNRFDISIYAFGSSLTQTDSFSFSEPQTNIQNALENLSSVHKDKNGATLLITDGNQTFGRDYLYGVQNYPHSILPVVVGDTIQYQDLSITRINVNKYAFLNNQFPVEVFINSTGTEAITSELRILQGDTPVFSERISLDGNNTSMVVSTTLPASRIGTSLYKVELRPAENEKNIANNLRNFALEVIDERSKILLVSDISHPDLGALKNAIESNPQRELELVRTTALPPDISAYSMAILYQPKASFGKVLEQLKQHQLNYWVVTGPETDWRFLNAEQDNFQKGSSSQTEQYFPVINPDFSGFQFEDIGFSELPPLIDGFGELSVTGEADVLLFQEVQGFATNKPLLATLEEGAQRRVYLFGADLWRWRSDVYTREASFEKFDEFLGGLVQFLSSGQQKDRLSVSYENFYFGNENIVLSSQYFDRNYHFDPRGRLTLELTNTNTGEQQELPLQMAGTTYQVDLSGLAASAYQFRIRVEGESLSRTGSFSVADYELEDQFTSADISGLTQLAAQARGDLYFLNRAAELKERLLEDKNYTSVQKSRQNRVYLADWYYLLGLIALFLAAEWFLRKYYGLI